MISAKCIKHHDEMRKAMRKFVLNCLITQPKTMITIKLITVIMFVRFVNGH